RFCKPTGLYDSCPWDDKVVRKWILDGKVAPRFPSTDAERELNTSTYEECPICFLTYEGVNLTVCCRKAICTECYLQVKRPRESVVCPFCNGPFRVTYEGPLSPTEVETRQREEQLMIEAKIRARQDEDRQQALESQARKERMEKEQHVSGATEGDTGLSTSTPFTVKPASIKVHGGGKVAQEQ
ncbi:unnamed protein product, partial [Chrysoparadoxa australica]